jgi:hypothetical protein
MRSRNNQNEVELSKISMQRRITMAKRMLSMKKKDICLEL